MTNRAAGCLSVSWEGKQNRDARCQFFIGGTGSGTHLMVQKIFIPVYHLPESIILWHLEYSSHTIQVHFDICEESQVYIKIKKMPYDHYEMTLLILEVT